MENMCSVCEITGKEIIFPAMMTGGHVVYYDSILNTGDGVNFIIRDTSALITAVRLGHEKCVKLLLRTGAGVNTSDSYGHSPLSKAAFLANYRCVDLLLRAGADVNRRTKEGQTALSAALGRRHRKCKRKFSTEDVFRVDEDHSHVKCVDLLVKAGANVNDTNANGDTALIYASLNGFHKCVELLIGNGALLDKCNKHGCGPLTVAASMGREQCVDILLRAGADVNKRNDKGRGPLVHAACNGFDRCVDLFLKAGADVNAITNKGNTPLNKAAFLGNAKSIQHLLSAGCRINTINYIGNNALRTHLTESKDVKDEVIILLYAAGETLRDVPTAKEVPQGKVPHSLKRNSQTAIREHLSLVQKPYWGAKESQIKIPDCLKPSQPGICLMQSCRKAIRDHLLKLDPHSHLFARVPQLGLPKQVCEFLLYYQHNEVSVNTENYQRENLDHCEENISCRLDIDADDNSVDEYYSCQKDF